MKFEYVVVPVVYESSSDKFDIGHTRIKGKVTLGLQMFYSFATMQTVRFHNLTRVQAHVLSMYIHLMIVYKIYKYHHV